MEIDDLTAIIQLHKKANDSAEAKKPLTLTFGETVWLSIHLKTIVANIHLD